MTKSQTNRKQLFTMVYICLRIEEMCMMWSQRDWDCFEIEIVFLSPVLFTMLLYFRKQFFNTHIFKNWRNVHDVTATCKIIGTFQRFSTASGPTLLLNPIVACLNYFESRSITVRLFSLSPVLFTILIYVWYLSKHDTYLRMILIYACGYIFYVRKSNNSTNTKEQAEYTSLASALVFTISRTLGH